MVLKALSGSGGALITAMLFTLIGFLVYCAPYKEHNDLPDTYQISIKILQFPVVVTVYSRFEHFSLTTIF